MSFGKKASPEVRQARVTKKLDAGEKLKSGSRGRLTQDFIYALETHFKEHGKDAIKIVFHEQPDVYLKLVASLVPREFKIEAFNPLDDLSDDDLLAMMEKVRRLKIINHTPAPSPPLIEHEHVNGNGRADG